MNGGIEIEDCDREAVGEYVGSLDGGPWGPHNVNDLARFAAWLRANKRAAAGRGGETPSGQAL